MDPSHTNTHHVVHARRGKRLMCFGAFALASLSTACSHTTLKAQAPLSLGFVYHDHRIMLPVVVEGETLSLLFDTGGSNVLDTAVATKLGLRTVSAGTAGGAGDGRIPMQRVAGINYRVGSIEMVEQDFIVLDLSPIKRAFGFERLDGVVGFELLQKYGVTIDYARRQMTLQPLETFAPKGRHVPFRLERRKPLIQGAVGDVATEFLVDTGDRSSFTLFSKFANAHRLTDTFAPVAVISGVGLGGPIPARLGTLPAVSFGSSPQIVSCDVNARLPTTKKDWFARSKLGGSVGNGLLQRFVVSFDYRRRRMTLSPATTRLPDYVFTPPATR